MAALDAASERGVTQPPARTRALVRTYRVQGDVGNVPLQMPHLRGIAQSGVKCGVFPRRCRRWRQNMASFAHVASRSQVASPDVTSKRCVTCPRGVREPGGVSRCGVKTLHHLRTWRQGAWWSRQMWRQNVASLAHVASGSHVALPDVASKCGVTCPRGVMEPRGEAGRGVRTWRQAPSTYVASQDVASRRGDRRPMPPGTCLQNVSSVVGRYVHPHRRTPLINRQKCVYALHI